MNEIEVLASNVRRIRLSKGLTQPQLAGAANVSLSAFKRLEGANETPSMRTVQAVAKALEVPLRDLFSPVKQLHAVRFRSRKKLRLRENILADVSRWISDFNELEAFLNEAKPFALQTLLGRFSGGQAVELAAQCRSLLGLEPDEPIHNITGLMESAGVKIFPVAVQSEDFFGLSVGESDGGPAIVVNEWERISVERRIYTVAHELGHLLMHLGAYNIELHEEDQDQESEADLFAAHFLMPDEKFRKEWSEASGLFWVDRVMKVKRIFRVSYKTVVGRMIEHGRADRKKIWKKFQIDYKRRFGKTLSFREEPQGLKADEPLGLEDFDFCEDRLSGLVRRAVEKDEISISRGAEILRIDIDSMRERLRDWEFA